MEIAVLLKNQVVLMMDMPARLLIHWRDIVSQRALVKRKNLVVKVMQPSVREKRRKDVRRRIAVKSEENVFLDFSR